MILCGSLNELFGQLTMCCGSQPLVAVMDALSWDAQALTPRPYHFIESYCHSPCTRASTGAVPVVLTITVGRTSTKSDWKLEEQDITWETVEGVLGACHSEVVKGKEGNRLEALSLLVSKGGVSRVSWFSLVLSRFTELKGVSGCRKLEGRVSYTGAHTSTWMLSTLCWVGDSKTDKSSATPKTPSLQHGAWVQSVCLNSFRETKWTTARMW